MIVPNTKEISIAAVILHRLTNRCGAKTLGNIVMKFLIVSKGDGITDDFNPICRINHVSSTIKLA